MMQSSKVESEAIGNGGDRRDSGESERFRYVTKEKGKQKGKNKNIAGSPRPNKPPSTQEEEERGIYDGRVLRSHYIALITKSVQEMDEKIKKMVLAILNESDITKMAEFKVHQLASERLGIDLSKTSYKAYVRSVVDSFLEERERLAEVAEEEEEEEKAKEEGSKGNKEFDDAGDLIICMLSDKRRVTIHEFRGKTLVSVREYYKKDGKELPTSKGISLTDEQWSTFKKTFQPLKSCHKNGIACMKNM